MSRILITALVASIFVLAARAASAQPLLDRVLERVQEDLDNRAKPIPTDDDPLLEDGNPQAQGREALQENEPGYLGVVADDRQEQGRGVRLLDVVAGAPAEQGGLKKSDVITAINTRPIRNLDEMARILSAMPVGAKIVFTVNRGDQTENVSVTLGARPGPGERRFEKFGRQPEELPDESPPAAIGPRPKLGVRTLPITAQAQEQFDLPSRDGALVVAVTAGSPAERAGIRVGAVITSLNGNAVRNPDQLAELVASSPDPFDVTLVQGGRQTRIAVPLSNDPTSGAVRRTIEPQPTLEPAGDETRLEAIERRMQELEDRIEKIEQMLESKT